MTTTILYVAGIIACATLMMYIIRRALQLKMTRCAQLYNFTDHMEIIRKLLDIVVVISSMSSLLSSYSDVVIGVVDMDTVTLSKQDTRPRRGKRMFILTDDQRLVVEKNMTLITAFMQKYGLWIKDLHISYEDMFQELAIELMASVYDFDPSKGTLATLFYYRAFNRIRQIYKYERRDSHKCNFINFSLNRPVDSDTPDEVGSIIRDPKVDVENTIISMSIVEDALKFDTIEILQVILKELTQDEAAAILGISQAQVCRKAKKLKERLQYKYA